MAKGTYRLWMRAARAKKHMTQKALAELLKVGNDTVSKIESGQSNPSIQLGCAIAMELEVDALEFMQFEASGYWVGKK